MKTKSNVDTKSKRLVQNIDLSGINLKKYQAKTKTKK